MKITEKLWNQEITKLMIQTDRVISRQDIDDCLFRRITGKDDSVFVFPKWIYTDLSKQELYKLSTFILTKIAPKYRLTHGFYCVDCGKTELTNLDISCSPKWLFGDDIMIKTVSINNVLLIYRIYYSSEKVDIVQEIIHDIEVFSRILLEELRDDEMFVKYSLVSTDPEKEILIDNIKRARLKKVTIDEFNPDLPDDYIMEALNENESGVFIFHGEPGCGKTSYIKKLISSNPDLDFCYLTTKMLEDTERFTNYIVSNEENKIIILEDCERLLHSRNYGSSSSSSLSDILNISDGLVGDQTKTKFIFTFNTQLRNLDDAILRPGRLKCCYEFTPLIGEKLHNLLEKLGIPESDFTKKDLENGIPIANLYHHKTINKIGGKNKGTKIGFGKK